MILRHPLLGLVFVAGLGTIPVHAANDCDDLTEGLVLGCPSITSRSGDDEEEDLVQDEVVEEEPDEEPEVANFLFKNQCRHTVRLAITYLDLDRTWRTDGWWSIAPGLRAYLTSEGERLSSHNGVWYYHAYCETQSCRWRGNHSFEFENETLDMRRRQDTDLRGDNSWGIKCPSR